MNISFNWLKEHVDLQNKSVQEVSEILTDIGLEVEDLFEYTTLKGSLKGVVVGHVLETWQHPNADKLRLTKVDIGQDEPLQIVCGAPNVAQGQKVPVATVGTELTFSDGNTIKIKKGKIRGEVSFGMICAEDELGIGESHDGIMVLDNSLVPGTNFENVIDAYRDDIIEIGLTPNRVDAACHRGTAIDLAAKLKTEIIQREITRAVKGESQVSISIKDDEACPRYAARIVRGVKVEPSPQWLQDKLKAIGLSPINNIVDITNYVMHDLGQPLHGFDLNEIKGDQIIVRRSEKGEKLITLDEIERELDGTELLICDSERALAFAGVLGGLHSGINENTADVLIESAYFNPSVVRRTAKKHQISTDSSFRFERGVDHNITIDALNFAAQLMQEIGGGKAEDIYVDSYPNQIAKAKISLDFEFLNRVIGVEIERDEVVDILIRLGFEVDVNADTIELIAPSNKPDVTRPVDVVEEVLRIYGYNTVGYDQSMKISIPSNKMGTAKGLYSKIASVLNGEGYFEIKSSPFTSDLDEKGLAILNPLSAEMTHLRNSQIASGLTSIAHNINRQQKNVRFFEIANQYSVSEQGYEENQFLTIWLTGDELIEDSWNIKNRTSSFYTLKAIVSKLFNAINIKHARLQPIENDNEWFYGLKDEQSLLKIGKLSSALTSKHSIDQGVFVAQIQYKQLLRKYGKLKIKYSEPSRFPQMVRDLSFILTESTKYTDILGAVNSTKTKFLKSVSCFDLYKGKPLDPGFASYALRFTFENKAKTLNDKQVEFEMTQITKSLESIGCQIRK
ncbi:MAG: phenylalanine--tRNA ligase subunit beta [Bacteroidia bacterium]